jgi:beta-1,2-mannobiose phosphorylase / 1,2-beta-oligomannan phosphorylase
MPLFERSYENPILVPHNDLPWEAQGAFNGCAIRNGSKTHLVYRAQSLPMLHDDGPWLSISSIGHAESTDGIHFKNHDRFIVPEESWERYGCEDPRVTKIDGKYYTFYTALGGFPFGPDNIKVGVAISKGLKKISEKHLVTPFNAKAMTLFPERINGKLWAILTADTDRMPPNPKIALASFDREEDIWDAKQWQSWYETIDEHTLHLKRQDDDHVEIGAPPVKTTKGWLMFYSHIREYGTDHPVFGIEALLLDLDNPNRIIGRTRSPLLVPEEEYEEYGKVKDIAFPSGAVIKGKSVYLYYGAADTTTCVAKGDLGKILEEITADPASYPMFERFADNPVMEPIADHAWESKAVFNPAAIFERGKVRILYRTSSSDDTSVFGYAESRDGFHISKRLPDPAYVPRAEFEQRKHPGNSGVEDPRITRIDETYHMFYTAVDAESPPRVAFTSISVKDFLTKRFDRFTFPKLVSPQGIDDKDACLFPETIDGKFVVLHRIQPSIDINFLDNLDFDGPHSTLTHNPFVFPRRGMWDNAKIGINSIPIRTKEGWLVLYHGVSLDNHTYRIGALLLDLKHPDHVIGRSRHPIFEPSEPYEKEGVVPNVVFPCGAIVRGNSLIIYYGGADKVIGVASISIRKLLRQLLADGN